MKGQQSLSVKCKTIEKVDGLEEFVTFDDVQRRFRFIVCLVMVGKANDVVIVF